MSPKKPPRAEPRTRDVKPRPKSSATASKRVVVEVPARTKGRKPTARRAAKVDAPSGVTPEPTPARETVASALLEADELIAANRRSRDAAESASTEGAAAAQPEARTSPSREEIQSRITELEGRLDRMLEAASQGSLPSLDADEDGDGDEAWPSQVAATHAAAPPSPATDELPEPPTERFPSPAPLPRPSAPAAPLSARSLGGEIEPTVFDTARELLSTNYYLRKWGRLGMRNRSEEVDDFGYDPVYEARVKPFLDFLYSTYFRVEAEGVEHVCEAGRCLLVANHSGTVPLDGLMIRAAVKRLHPRERDVRWLAEDFIFHFPFLGSLTTRLGAVRACQENAERLLRQEALVAVFPEGMKGTGKLFRERYRLQRFGRGGFVKLALRTRTPIVPVAVVGGEETQPLLARLDALGKPFGLPYVPVTPTFPLLGPAGLMPAPTKWRMRFGAPIVVPGSPDDADDELLVGRLAEEVRGTIQEMVDELLGARKNVFLG